MKARTPLTKVQRERLERFLGSMSRGIAAAVAADHVECILGIPSRAIYALDSEADDMQDCVKDAYGADLNAETKDCGRGAPDGSRSTRPTTVSRWRGGTPPVVSPGEAAGSGSQAMGGAQ